MTAEIISIGTELLLGSVINTNAAYISKRLAEHGVNVYWQTVVGDNAERLLQAFTLAFSRADLVITTGGLGPTDDDLTKETAAAYFNAEMVPHEPSIAAITAFFNRIGRTETMNNKKQGYFPEGAAVLPNGNGTAPGCMLERGGKTLFLLPGPPREMTLMFENGVVPYLKQKQEFVLVSRDLRVAGMGESTVADTIGDIIKEQTNPTIATYPGETECIVRITAKAKNAAKADKLIQPMADAVYGRLCGGGHPRIYAEGEQTLEETVIKLLLEKRLTVTFAESCTGGLLSGRLVNAAGVSAVYRQGFVTYSNESKTKLLGVSPETLAVYGAVSEQCAAEMAAGAADAAGADIGVSVTGIAGPDGATADKPVGLVYIGISIGGETRTERHVFAGDRTRVRLRAVVTALDMLRCRLLNM